MLINPSSSWVLAFREKLAGTGCLRLTGGSLVEDRMLDPPRLFSLASLARIRVILSQKEM